LTAFRNITTIVLVGASLMAAGHTWSQMPPGGGGRGSAGRGPDTSLVPPPRNPVDLDAPKVTVVSAVKYRLELLQEDLRLRPEQDAVWLAYSDRVLKLANDLQRTARTALGGEMPAPKRLDGLADIARDRLTAIEDIADAGKNLYAALTPSQQAVADRRMAVPVMALVGVEPAGGARTDPAKSP
jgi:LTXXQ motif family protein